MLISKEPWNSESVDIFLHGAVTDQLFTGLVLQNNCIVQVTQVNCYCIWLCPKPWQPRNCLSEDMNNFYEHDYGGEWTVPDTRYCSPGRCMAAMYQDIGYHRDFE